MISAAPVIRRAGGRDSELDRVGVVAGLGVALADPGEEEDLVVHREPEQDGEEEERYPGLDDVDAGEAEEPVEVALLEDEHEQPVRGRRPRGG